MAQQPPRHLHDFLRSRIIEEAWTDKRIATHLGVQVTTARLWRVALGLPRAKKLRVTFDARHGEGALAAFVTAYRAGISLTALGRRFGFSKQNAWYIVQQLRAYGWLETPPSSAHALGGASP